MSMSRVRGRGRVLLVLVAVICSWSTHTVLAFFAPSTHTQTQTTGAVGPVGPVGRSRSSNSNSNSNSIRIKSKSSSITLKASSNSDVSVFKNAEDAMVVLDRASTVFGQNKYAISKDDIYDAIRYLERSISERKSEEDSERLFNSLSPNSWQLVLTTGDLSTQKKL